MTDIGDIVKKTALGVVIGAAVVGTAGAAGAGLAATCAGLGAASAAMPAAVGVGAATGAAAGGGIGYAAADKKSKK